ncbi:hypothetical protein QNI16_26715 [Cytophagaceae bacterium YF14B1]|uniref:HTH araC/xylS-type domain-containing protein n=1 Tax=Xanthocytophaga flava TaxID=3048013 RepID=A0AAE3QWK3_9BACT|nr:hypothetical protein [Xanthocytophaga flavus]MDJ1484119.1 hypothetical protein [Xanthocytophaga flavus]
MKTQTSTSTTYIPKGILKEFVGSIVHLNGLGTGIALQRVYQTIVINIGANFFNSDPYTTEPSKEHLPAIWINGKHEHPFALENPGVISLYVIGIKPGMLPYFSRVPVVETNSQALCATYWAESDIFTLRERLLESTDVQTGFELIEAYFISRLEGKNFLLLPKIHYLSKAITNNTVAEICATMGCTRKKLRTDAIQYFGAPVKNMQGIIRFGQHLTAIASQPHQSLSSLHSFYDQAHFIKDFKVRTGMTPGQYRLLCQKYSQIRYNPNFIPLPKETFLQFIASHPD